MKNPFDSTLDSDRDAFVTKFPKGGGNSVAYIISDRAELSVSIAGNKMMVSSLFLRFLEHFPNAFPILRHIQGL